MGRGKKMMFCWRLNWCLVAECNMTEQDPVTGGWRQTNWNNKLDRHFDKGRWLAFWKTVKATDCFTISSTTQNENTPLLKQTLEWNTRYWPQRTREIQLPAVHRWLDWSSSLTWTPSIFSISGTIPQDLIQTESLLNLEAFAVTRHKGASSRLSKQLK